MQSALQNVGDRLTASVRPVKDAPLFNFGIGASFELDKAMVQPIVSGSIHMLTYILARSSFASQLQSLVLSLCAVSFLSCVSVV